VIELDAQIAKDGYVAAEEFDGVLALATLKLLAKEDGTTALLDREIGVYGKIDHGERHRKKLKREYRSRR